MGQHQSQRDIESRSVPDPEPGMPSSAELFKPVTSLPRYVTTFIGREQERRAIRALLAREDVRLLTLRGPGGAGKTRLALEVVTQVVQDYADGPWFVSLATMPDPQLVIPALAQAVGVRQVSGRTVKESLIHFLRERQALLIIDNFETVIEGSAQLPDILSACPMLKILVTSRIMLQVSGEHVYVVPPLALPNDGHLTPTAQLGEVESIRLFTDRAASSSGFLLTPDNAVTVVDICRRLDGLPLALELAAAQTALLSPSALLTRLQRQVSTLAAGPRDAPERHRSMRHAIAWSYDLLLPDEQLVFQRLSVFSGGFTLDEAEVVVAGTGDMFEILASLVAKSLVVPVEAAADEPRFTMLETLREYGVERLREEGDESTTRDRHAAFYLDEAIRNEYAWAQPLEEGVRQLNQLRIDQANMREALGWLYQSGDIAACLRMAGALEPLWIVGSQGDEGQAWLDRLLADPRPVDDSTRARALRTLSWISDRHGHTAKAYALAEEGLALFRRTGDLMGTIECLAHSARAAERKGNNIAVARRREAIELLNDVEGPDWVQNWIHSQLVELGAITLRGGSRNEAEILFNRALELQTSRGYTPGTSHIFGSHVLAGVSFIAKGNGDLLAAIQYMRQSLDLSWRFTNIRSCAHAICGIAGLLAALGNYATAARLFGASEALHEAYGYTFSETFNQERAYGLPEPWAREGESLGDGQMMRDALGSRVIRYPRLTLDPDLLAKAWHEGRELSLERAVTEAMAAADAAIQPSGAEAPHGLTPRELDVIRLLAEGQSNRVIADDLSLSERTIENHVTHILTKLGMESRTAVAVYAVQHGLV